jgi:hypothetical protein
MTASGSVLDTVALSVGLGTPLARGLLDVSLRYRPALSRYQADTATFLEHAAGARLAIAPAGELSFSLDADAITGRDVDVLLLQTLLTWRPLGG